MTNLLQSKILYFIIFIFILTLIPINPRQSDARKGHYIRTSTREQAIETIQVKSEYLCDLVGLEPKQEDTVVKEYQNADELMKEGEIVEELKLEDDVSVDMDQFRKVWLDYVSSDEEIEYTTFGVSKTAIMDIIMEWLGTRYRYGGTTARGIDCSAFVRLIFEETANIMLPRTARAQYKVGDEIKRKNLEFGDIVFFHTRRRPYVSHVGIYLEDNLFAHASSRYGVTISSLESQYYGKRLIGARRLASKDLMRYSLNNDDNLTSMKGE